MKKIIQLILVVGLMSGVVQASEVADEDIHFQSKYGTNYEDVIRDRYKFRTPKKAVIFGGNKELPEGYIADEFHPHVFRKELPISGRHEKYEQHIEGYTSPEAFEQEVREGKSYFPKIEPKEREWLLGVEKEARRPVKTTHHEDEVRFMPNFPDDIKKIDFYTPDTQAVIPVSASKNIPEGYHQEGNYYVKQLPISGRHEKYEQFISGYEPEEDFEQRMAARRSPLLMKYLGKETSEEDIRRHLQATQGGKYREKVAKESKWYSDIEKGNIRPSQYKVPKSSSAYKAIYPEPSYWTKFVNWIWSFGKTVPVKQKQPKLYYGISTQQKQPNAYYKIYPEVNIPSQNE